MALSIKRATLWAALFAALAFASPSPATPRLSCAERELVRLACSHSVVMLGENAHGDGATIALKTRIIPELVRRCGFSALAFESSYYDFAELRRITSPEQNYDRRMVQSAVGRLWSWTAEFSPLADWLAQQSPNDLTLAGIDDQIGAAGAFYSLMEMPADLAALTPDDQRAACRSLFALDGWGDLDPPAQRAWTERCLTLALDQLSRRDDGDAAHLRALAEAFRRANARGALQGDDLIAARDRAMADNLDAFRRSLPPGTKIIVWTANGHAAGGGLARGETLAQIARDRYGSDLFTVGFSAAGGQYRWSRSEVRDVSPASADSLETLILGRRSAAVASHRRLVALGAIPGTALSWHTMASANWSSLFDAIFVLRREELTTPIVLD